jgi:hypothetical protein
MSGQDDRDLPPPPERPDCCFGGCAQCVLDDYADQMARWQEQVDAILRAREASGAAQRDNKPG